MEAQLKNVLLSQEYSLHQRPESTPVHVEYTVDTSEYGFLKIEVLTWSYVRCRFRVEVTNTIELSVYFDVESNLMKILRGFHESCLMSSL